MVVALVVDALLAKTRQWLRAKLGTGLPPLPAQSDLDFWDVPGPVRLVPVRPAAGYTWPSVDPDEITRDSDDDTVLLSTVGDSRWFLEQFPIAA